jgi:MFS superfamily sulfate permease-like transporter
LNQSLRAHAGVHACGLLVVVVVEDVRCAETQQWTATVDAVEVIVCICYAEMAGIFSGILVGVPYECAFGLFRVSPRPASQRDVRI